jgi:paraquat-inducible protein B
MTEIPEENVQAHLRAHRRFSWVWIVPIAAAIIVIWLAWRSLAGRGPEITISFTATHGLTAGESTVQHLGVVVGTVESLELTPDMSHVIVHVRMRRAAKESLNVHTQFYIVSPRVGAGGISGLTTLVSGSYIEMYPGKDGEEMRDFTGLDDPPELLPNVPGRLFTLESDDLGSLTRGATISYRGIEVGEIEGYVLDKDQRTVRITAFVRAPYDKLVYPQTRFWNSGGLDVTVGTQGVRIRSNSLQQLLSGGVEFDTPKAALSGEPADANSVYTLYENERRALRDPRNNPLVYHSVFDDTARDLSVGAAVELMGVEVGAVNDVHLAYDAKRRTLTTLVTFAIDPDAVSILDMPATEGKDDRTRAGKSIELLVGDGLRARMTTASLLTGRKVVALDMVKAAPSAHIEHRGTKLYIPSTSSGDLTDTLQSMRNVLDNLNRATSGPELGHAIKSLDNTLTHLDQITRDVQPDVKGLIKSLRDTADSAQKALDSVQGAVGNFGSNGADLAETMRQVKDAARSVRALADYLDRHPESIVRGRKGNDE